MRQLFQFKINKSLMDNLTKVVSKSYSSNYKPSSTTKIESNSSQYTLNTGLFINGEFLEQINSNKIEVYDPSKEELICEVAEGNMTDIDFAVSSARQAFNSWSKVPSDERSKLFSQLANKVESHIEELSWLEGLDNGKPLADAREDMKEVARLIRYFGGLCENIYGKTYMNTNETTIQTRRVPYGVVGCITPWNYPLLMTAWKILPPLAAGNAVVLKQSEITPITGLKFAKIFQSIDFPPGLLNILTGYGHTIGQYLSSHPDVDKIAFTGSTLTGRKVMKAAADSNLKNVSLELGGKSPMVVFNDADLTSTVEWVIDGAFRNTSQNCAAGSRLYIQEGIYEKFVELVCERTKKITIGRFDQEGIWMGPLVNKRQYDNCLDFLKIAEEEKLEPALKGGKMSETFPKGYYISPSIFINVPEDSRLAREEIFGPILTILKPFKHIDEVIEKCNDSLYGLASGCFTSDSNKAEYFIRNIKSGTVWINNYNLNPYNVPFGGMKQSGFGRDCGDEALLENTVLKSVYHKFDFKF